MSKAIYVTLAITLLSVWGCNSPVSPEGGKEGGQEGFRIMVPVLGATIKQGDSESVTIDVHREKYFKEDVKVKVEPAEGITVDPTEVMVKASEPGKFSVRISVPAKAALGEYPIYVKGTPAVGEPTTAEFKVKVKAP